MKFSKNLINLLLVVFACFLFSSVNNIVEGTKNAKKVLSQSTEKEYVMPYPGILPDHPFYKLKMVRDKIWEFLISDLERKAYFEILQADKRMEAARILIQIKNKNSLGISTGGKAYAYLIKIPSLIKALRERNVNVNNLIDKLEKSCLKHQSIMEKIEAKPSVLTSGEKKNLQFLVKAYQKFCPEVLTLH